MGLMHLWKPTEIWAPPCKFDFISDRSVSEGQFAVVSHHLGSNCAAPEITMLTLQERYTRLR